MAEALRVHGGLDPDELAAAGVAAEDVVDFSVNVNPYGPARAMLAAIAAAPIDVYPDASSRAARRALAEDLGEDPARVVLGNGAAELLWTLARVLLPPGAATVVVGPTFSEWGAAARAAGAEVAEVRAHAAEGFTPPLAEAAALARRTSAPALYLCNPNNPTGVGLRGAAVASFAAGLPGVTIILDEAFLSLSELPSDRTYGMPANVVRVRSLTKEHALPGLRVGYATMPAPLALRVEAARPAWTVSAGAQAAAIASVGLRAFVADSRARMLADRRALADALAGLGLPPLPTTTTYALVDVGDAAVVRRRLLASHGVLVRGCASFGLPAHIRVASRLAGERKRLIEALGSWRDNTG